MPYENYWVLPLFEEAIANIETLTPVIQRANGYLLIRCDRETAEKVSCLPGVLEVWGRIEREKKG